MEIFQYEGGKEKKILITVGFDDEGEPKEVFCADFKAGTTLHSIVMDACILLSRLLQHGDMPVELLDSMCQPPSLIGAIAAAIADCKGPRRSEGEPLPGYLPSGPPHAPVPDGAVLEVAHGG